MKSKFKTMDADEAVAYVAYRVSEVIAIYPITPSSAMGEWEDEWSSRKIQNIWGTVPHVAEMQSEGGAAGLCMARCKPARWPLRSLPPRVSSSCSRT
jgi:pyruvate-ferredoxin/flavodoxin oxidoreductase